MEKVNHQHELNMNMKNIINWYRWCKRRGDPNNLLEQKCNARVEARERQNKMVETKYKEVRTKSILEFKQPDLEMENERHEGLTPLQTHSHMRTCTQLREIFFDVFLQRTSLNCGCLSLLYIYCCFSFQNEKWPQKQTNNPPKKNINKKPSSSVLSKEAVSNDITMLEKNTCSWANV